MATETLHKKLFTVEEFMRMSEAGVFPPEGRFELIRGEILEVPPPGPPHAGRVDRLTHILSRAFGDAFIVSVQNPAALDNFSQPMPDLKVLKFRPDFYIASHPGPRDILLAIEVSHTTMEYDVKVKAPLYADAGIPEYWIVDVTNDRLVVHTHPSNGRFSVVTEYRRGQSRTPRRLPGFSFTVDEILGPPAAQD